MKFFFSNTHTILLLINLFQSIHSNPTCNKAQLYGVEDDCTKYLTCFDGKLVEFRCPKDRFFDPTKKLCDKRENVKCLLAGSSTKSTLITPMPSSLYFDNSKIELTENCTRELDFLGVAHDCSKYLRCVYGILVEMKCSNGTLFDYINKDCEHPKVARCYSKKFTTTIQTTTTIPTTTTTTTIPTTTTTLIPTTTTTLIPTTTTTTTIPTTTTATTIPTTTTTLIPTTTTTTTTTTIPTTTTATTIPTTTTATTIPTTTTTTIPTTTTTTTTTTIPTTTTTTTTTTIPATTTTTTTTTPTTTSPATTTTITIPTTTTKRHSTLTIITTTVLPNILSKTTSSTHTSSNFSITNTVLNSNQNYCTQEDDYSGVMEDCSKFLRCVHGEYVEFNCAKGTLFDHVKKQCVYRDQVKCLANSSVKTLNVCTNANDFIGVEEDCSKFKRCFNGQYVEFKCAPGTLFDHQKKICDHSYSSKCLGTSTDTTTTKVYITDALAGLTKSNKVNVTRECTASDDYTSVSNDCSKFYRCMNGKLVIHECDADLKFDRIFKRCLKDAVCFY